MSKAWAVVIGTCTFAVCVGLLWLPDPSVERWLHATVHRWFGWSWGIFGCSGGRTCELVDLLLSTAVYTPAAALGLLAFSFAIDRAAFDRRALAAGIVAFAVAFFGWDLVPLGIRRAAWQARTVIESSLVPEHSQMPAQLWVWVVASYVWFPFFWAALAVYAIVRRARTSPVGCCRRCRYDLTGNVSGTCPECGTPTG